jgi:RHS repeat-associated protein
MASPDSTGSVTPVYSFTYNAIGLPTQTVDPSGVTTNHGYDGYGNLTSTTEGAVGGSNPQWGTTHWGSPAAWGTVALNLTNQFTPDAWGNVVATTDPLGHVSKQTFDLDRRVLWAVAPDPGTGIRTATSTTYDANGRTVEVDKGTTNAAGTVFTALETTTTAFDPNGNETQVSVLNGPSGSAALAVTQMSYDPLNRPVCTAERENAATFNALPGACTQSAGGSTGPDHITQLTYDLAGQKLVETRGLGTSIAGPYATWAYGQDGELATILDANNNLTTNLYDGFNRLAKVEYPMPAIGSGASNPADAESYAYDANGNRVSLTKRDGTTVIGFAYDPLNRMAAKTFAAAAANVAYAYDFAGRPTGAVFATVSGTPGVTWTYDAAGRRIGEATNGRSLAFTYDGNGNPATMTWPDGLSVTYAFDTANRFSSVGSAAATVTASYDSLSRLNALSRTGGANSAIGYDAADRMASLAHSFVGGTGNQGWGFGFTAAGQLATASSSNGAWDWSQGAAAAVATVADGLNRNATVAGVGQTYDAFGDLTSDGTRAFTYDAENRLLTESATGISLALAYDPLGRLQQSVINGTTTQFLYDHDRLVGEYPASGNTPLRRYVNAPAEDQALIWYEGGTMGAGAAHLLLTDRQGSVVATATTGGALAANYSYDPYGTPNTWGTVGTVPRFRYTGQIGIPEAKLYHYKARVYDPAAGRFLQTDPVGYGPDVNWYLYVADDPLDNKDPTGMLTEEQLDFQNYVRTQVEPTTRGQLVAGAGAVIGLGTTGGAIAVGGGAAVATSSAIGGFFGGASSALRGGSLSDVFASVGKGAVSSAFTNSGGAAGKLAGTPGLVAGEIAGAYAGAKATGATDYEANVSAGVAGVVGAAFAVVASPSSSRGAASVVASVSRTFFKGAVKTAIKSAVPAQQKRTCTASRVAQSTPC